eukprot:2479141-Lingulodinium_polyedra.AAC.1
MQWKYVALAVTTTLCSKTFTECATALASLLRAVTAERVTGSFYGTLVEQAEACLLLVSLPD